jgi:hypothetical protein
VVVEMGMVSSVDGSSTDPTTVPPKRPMAVSTKYTTRFRSATFSGTQPVVKMKMHTPEAFGLMCRLVVT